jgi:hypothetical protein
MGKLATDPTPEQIEWLKSNYKNMTVKQISKDMRISSGRITRWLKMLSLKKYRVCTGRVVKKKKIEHKNQPIAHLSREYSNVTREEHVARILSIKI